MTILWVEVGPSEDLIRTLAEARIREKKMKKPEWEARELGLKILTNAGSYGVFVELNRKGHVEEATIHGLGGEPFETTEELEEPGVDYCPLLGAMVTSGAHLLPAMVDRIAGELGGRVFYCDTRGS